MKLFGIPNCDTVKNARAWLDGQGLTYVFHDYRRDGVPVVALRGWVAALGWAALLNRAGTTFRRLPDGGKADLDDERAVALMIAHPAAIRRPVLVVGDRPIVGFSPERYAAVLLPPAAG